MAGRSSFPDRLEIVTAGTPGCGAPGEAPTLVFVHGATHSAACWGPFQHWFAERGIASIALSLRGYGTSQGRGAALWLASLRDFEADLALAIEAHVGLGPFVLVGHGLGGSVVQRYLFTLARSSTLPCPAGVVLLCAATARVWGGLARQAPGAQGLGWRSLLAFLRAGRPPVIATSQAVRRYYFTPQTDEQVVLSCWEQVRGQKGWPLRALWEQRRFPVADGSRSPRCSIPLRVFGAERDVFVTAQMTEATAAAYAAPWRVFPGAGHNLMLDAGWQEVAGAIAAFARALPGALAISSAPGVLA
jgi:pimeloyl-ACP methyl ester carboxylesterase